MAALKIKYKDPQPAKAAGTESTHAHCQTNQADCGEHQRIRIYQSGPD